MAEPLAVPMMKAADAISAGIQGHTGRDALAGRRAVLTASQRARAREVDAELAAMDALAARFPTVEAEARWWLGDTLAVDPLTPDDTVTAAEHACGAAWQIHGA